MARRKIKPTLTIATFNLENFQSAGKRLRHKEIETQSNFIQKSKWISRQIEELEADIIAFQELWSKDALESVFENKPEYKLIFMKSSWPEIAVAYAIKKDWNILEKKVYSKFRFSGIKIEEIDANKEDYRFKRSAFARPVLYVKIQHAENSKIKPIHIYNVHFKSRLDLRVNTKKSLSHSFKEALENTGSSTHRLFEAAGIRGIIDGQLKGTQHQVIVLGDFNDIVDSNALNIVTGEPKLAGMGTKSADTALYNTIELQKLKSFRDWFFTKEHNGKKSTIDHILVSGEFFESHIHAKWQHLKTIVINDHIDLNTKGASDHGIVKSTFRLL